MQLYKKMYLHLFNAITDTIELLQQGKLDEAKQMLIQAQQETEEIYIGYDGEDEA